MCEILNICSLRAFEAGDFRLEEIVAQALFGVLRFQPIDLAGLGADLRLQYLKAALAGSHSRFELTPYSFEFGFDIAGCCVRFWDRGRAIASPASTIPLPVATAGRTEALCPP